MTNPPRRRSRLWLLTLLNLGLLLLLWAAETLVAERFWLTTAILYFPQHWIGVPGVLLLLWALQQRHKKAMGLNVVSLGFFVFYFLGFNLPLHRSTPGRNPIRVMTYNIHYGSDDVKRVAEAVNQQNPDILCLQETRAWRGWPDPIPELKRLLPGWHMTRGAEVATFSRFPIISHRKHPMPEPNERVVLETVVEVRGRRLSVFNTHFSTAGSFQRQQTNDSLPWWATPHYVSGTARVRMRQLPVLLRAAAGATSPAIICGDFNNPPRGRLYRRLTQNYTDAFAARGLGFGHTFRSDLPVMRIDYILAGKGVAVHSSHVPLASASDHRPVVAEISLDNG